MAGHQAWTSVLSILSGSRKLKDAYTKGRICELDYKLLKEMISDSINNMGHLL